MKIDRYKPYTQLEAMQKPDANNKKQAPGAEIAQTGNMKKDTVNISGAAKDQNDIAKYVKMVKEMKDVRPKEVEQARKNVQSGAYNRKGVYLKTAENILKDEI